MQVHLLEQTRSHEMQDIQTNCAVCRTLSDHVGLFAVEQVFDFERMLNDFVFLTFLAGNDFLPNIPSLEIYDRPSALDTLLVRKPAARFVQGC